MRRIAVVLLGLLAAALPVWADAELDKLKEDFDKARQEYWQAREKSPGDAKDPCELFIPKFKTFAEAHAGKPEAIDALTWLVNNPTLNFAANKKYESAIWALERLARDHAGDPALLPSLPRIGYGAWYTGVEPIAALYERVLKENKDAAAQASAKTSLAVVLFENAPRGEADKDKAADKSRQRAVELFRDVLKNHADAPDAKRAEGYLFEIEKLQIGMTAPDVEGENADGKPVKLSDFRGRVVVVDFWGFW